MEFRIVGFCGGRKIGNITKWMYEWMDGMRD
jgi:hypothetical protein